LFSDVFWHVLGVFEVKENYKEYNIKALISLNLGCNRHKLRNQVPLQPLGQGDWQISLGSLAVLTSFFCKTKLDAEDQIIVEEERSGIGMIFMLSYANIYRRNKRSDGSLMLTIRDKVKIRKLKSGDRIIFLIRQG